MINNTTNLQASRPYATPPTSTITVGIADDHQQFAKALAHIITSHPALSLAFMAPDGNRLLEETLRQKPMVVLTDIQMPLMDGAKACRLIKGMAPETEIIALSMFCDAHHVWQMYEAGARGYLTKTTDEAQIYEAIFQVHRKESYWCQTASQHLQQFGKGRAAQWQCITPKNKAQFSELELQVMRLICTEKSCKLVADELNICKRTIDSVYERLRRKTGAQNLVGIALYAVRHGLATLSA